MSSSINLDHATLFVQLQNILSERWRSNPADCDFAPINQPLQSFSSPDGNVTGSLLTFTGKETDWMVYSWFNAAQMRFSTMRLTLWLSPLIQVPHLAFECGTKPISSISTTFLELICGVTKLHRKLPRARECNLSRIKGES